VTSEEYLRATTVGELKPMNSPVTLVDYDPEWPRLFAREAARIRTVLGETALRVERPEVDRMLGFRDWLRAHDEEHYADAKSDVVREIMDRADIEPAG
jgi:GrpB-like predicted nucleotidyltransferase (UPF0157 family)